MRKLDTFKSAIESEVERYLEELDITYEYNNDFLDFEFELEGRTYGCTVKVSASFSFSDYTETDIYGISHKLGEERELESSEFYFVDLFEITDEDELYIVKNGKQIA